MLNLLADVAGGGWSTSEIVSLISSVGFPIVMCLIMLYIFQKIIKDLNSQHKSEMDKMTEALNNNTQVLLELKESLQHVTNK